MDQMWLFGISLVLIFYLLKRNKFLGSKKEHKKIPPSPSSLPIIGHLHLLNKKPPLIHRTLQQLSSQYGSIYSLKLGVLPLVIISSPAAVEECFTKYDIILANRPRVLVGKHFHYDWTSVGAAPYGPLWLNLRKLINLQLFGNTRMNSFASVRVDEVQSLIKCLFIKTKHNFTKVEMSSHLTGLAFNILTRIVVGKKYISANNNNNNDDSKSNTNTHINSGSGSGSDNSNNNINSRNKSGVFIGITREIFELGGELNMVDIFPFMRWFHNFEKRMVEARRKIDDFLDDIIEECKRNKNGCESSMIYKFLNSQESEDNNYTNEFIKGIMLIMLIAGTTSSATVVWALTLLLNHPNVLRKARDEIDNYKANGELVEEADLPKLAYIQCIINETLRLFPAAPLLFPHVPSEDITISGYQIDKGNLCIINAWAIHRDPNLWEDPLKFRPERFQGLKTEDYRFTFIPFGLGRRSCPGASLANRIIGLTLATLIQCFDWETVDGMDLDLTEIIGLAMTKAKPLEVMCRARKTMIDVLSKM